MTLLGLRFISAIGGPPSGFQIDKHDGIWVFPVHWFRLVGTFNCHRAFKRIKFAVMDCGGDLISATFSAYYKKKYLLQNNLVRIKNVSSLHFCNIDSKSRHEGGRKKPDKKLNPLLITFFSSHRDALLSRRGGLSVIGIQRVGNFFTIAETDGSMFDWFVREWNCEGGMIKIWYAEKLIIFSFISVYRFTLSSYFLIESKEFLCLSFFFLYFKIN